MWVNFRVIVGGHFLSNACGSFFEPFKPNPLSNKYSILKTLNFYTRTTNWHTCWRFDCLNNTEKKTLLAVIGIAEYITVEN